MAATGLICAALQGHLSSCVVPVLIVILSVLALQQIRASDVALVEATTMSTPPISMRLVDRPRSSAHGTLSSSTFNRRSVPGSF